MCDYETYDVSTTKTVKARKQYQCSDGHHNIEKGETYTKITGLFDGKWWTDRICSRCTAARTALHHNGQHDCPVAVGGLIEAIREEYVEYYRPDDVRPEWLQKLAQDFNVKDHRANG